MAWKSSKRKPKLGGEYNVVWVLDDGGYPVSTTLEYCSIKKQWTDVISNSKSIVDDNKVLFWDYIPKPPRGIKKELYQNIN